MILVVGLGNLGSAIARRLIATGHAVGGVDLVEGLRDAFANDGGSAYAQLADVPWADVDKIFVVVRMTDQADEVLRYVAKVDDGADRSAFLVTTLDTTYADSLGTFNTPRLRVIESPISGGAQWVSKGQLTIALAGPVTGDDREFLSATVAGTLVEFADYGQPTVAKLINNAVMTVNVQVVADALAFAERCGMDPVEFFGFVSTSAGQSRATELFTKLNASLLEKDADLLRSFAADKLEPNVFGRAIEHLENLEGYVAPARQMLAASGDEV